jgi:hypothetical protein
VPNFQCETKEEAELQVSVALDWEQNKPNKKIIQSFKSKKFESALAKVMENDRTPVWQLGIDELRRFF